MPEMTKEEYINFLSEGTKTGKLATVRKDGRPHVTPIWFEMDGDDLIFNTHKDSVKGRNMARDPRVAISVDDQQPLYSYVTIEGTATLSDDPIEILHWATRIGGRYMGEDKADAYGKRNAGEGELLVRVIPDKVLAYKDIAAW